MRKIALGAAAIVALAASPAFAATATNTMPVSVNVINSCTVSASPMSFGSLSSVGGANVDTSADMSVNCTINAAYDVAVSLGANAATGTQRYLVSTTDATKQIPYNLYSDALRTKTWGPSSPDTVTGTGSGVAQTLTAYGRIPSSASAVPAGTYKDTVTITVTF
jgi:spore coat protein U-like protein